MQISFLINTSKDTLEYVKLLLRSLKENLFYKEHEILVFVDSDNEATIPYLESIKKDFYDLKIIKHSLPPCIGYSRNNNLLVELAKHDIVSYLQADMVVSQNYDKAILAALEENCILSATRIEPPLHGESDVTITANFGLHPSEFKWNEFTSFAETVKQDKDVEFFFAPLTFYKKDWLETGGYDTLFRRSREDSDLLQRLKHKGVKIKQTFLANVYHFTCTTSRGPGWFDNTNTEAKRRVALQQQADMIELRRFVKKWGSFSHGEKLSKLDIDLQFVRSESLTIPKPSHIRFYNDFEPFVSRVWIDDQALVFNLINTNYEAEHTFANMLLSFSEKQWATARKFYNQTKWEEVYKIGVPSSYNTLVRIDLSKFVPNKTNLDILANIQPLLQSYEEGQYEHECLYFDIKTKVDLTQEQIIVKNPEFDYSLLTIY